MILRMASCASLIGALVSMGPARGADSRQVPVDFTTEVTVKIELPYLLFLPDGYDARDNWPLIVFLHGAGERGRDLERVKMHGPPKIVESKTDFPFVVISPQCSERRFWDADAVAALVEDAIARYKVDPDRVYLTGLSMGGYGTWATAAARPDLFAAIVPICGGGDASQAEKLKHLPIWVFHGDQDPTVPLERSQEMVDALKQLGADVQFTVYPGVGHDSWTASYDNPKLYEWLLSHRRQVK